MNRIMIYVVVLITLFLVIYGIIVYMKKRKTNLFKGMKEFIINLLKSIGCQPEVNKTGDVTFMYQGEYFVIQILSERLVRICDLWWLEMKLDDPRSEYLKEAINLTNQSSPVTVLYSVNQEKSLLGVHCVCQTDLFKEVPDMDSYMAYLLDSCFKAQQEVNGKLSALIHDVQTVKTPDERVKIKGFK